MDCRVVLMMGEERVRAGLGVELERWMETGGGWVDERWMEVNCRMGLR